MPGTSNRRAEPGGLFQRETKQIQKDINTYAVPSDLKQLMSILFGITLHTPVE